MNDWIIPSWPAPANVKSIFTTRSAGNFCQHFNLATHVGDDVPGVLKNRAHLKDILKLSNEPLWLTQKHSAIVSTTSSLIEADASITTQIQTPCVVLTADCLPILFCNKKGSKVAATHAGWRGLAKGIIANTVHMLHEPADQFLAWLGPAIGPEKFQVGPEILDQFLALNPANAAAFKPDNAGKYLANIFMLARLQLEKLGVQSISSSELCTVSDPKRFFSYRREGDSKETGRMAALIWLE